MNRITATSANQITLARSVRAAWLAMPAEKRNTRKGRRALWGALRAAGLPTSWVRHLVWGVVTVKGAHRWELVG